MKILIKFAWVLFAVLLLLKCIGCTRLPWWKVFLPLGVVAGGCRRGLVPFLALYSFLALASLAANVPG